MVNCFPSCNIPLSKNHNARIVTSINTCTTPAQLTLTVTGHDGSRQVSTFVAGNQQELRTIGSDYYPLQLQVKFQEVEGAENNFHTEACIHTLRSGNVTCFMNGLMRIPFSDSCAPHKSNHTGFPILLLCVILATCLLMVTVAVVAMVHRFLRSSQRAHGSRKPSRLSIGKPQPPYASLMEAGYIQKYNLHDERLSAIVEVDDEKDNVSIGSSSGFESGPPTKSVSEEFTNTTEISDARSFLPLNLAEKRRQSQPLLFPTSPSMESFKPTVVPLQRRSIVAHDV